MNMLNRTGNQKTFHKDIFMPDFAREKIWSSTSALTYSDHAKHAALNDKFSVKGYSISLPKFFNFEKATLIESTVESVNGKWVVVKQVYRGHYNHKTDLVIVVDYTGLVRTVWLNGKTDKHKTLDKSKFALA